MIYQWLNGNTLIRAVIVPTSCSIIIISLSFSFFSFFASFIELKCNAFFWKNLTFFKQFISYKQTIIISLSISLSLFFYTQLSTQFWSFNIFIRYHECIHLNHLLNHWVLFDQHLFCYYTNWHLSSICVFNRDCFLVSLR